MRKLYLIGIGAGNPEYITMQAVKVLNLVNVFFFVDKGDSKEDLILLRKEICERYISEHSYRIVEITDPIRDPQIADYTTRVEQWHHQRILLYEEMMRRNLGEDETGALLVWGDPSLYDSTLRIVHQLEERANLLFDYEVIPGITSLQALAARHRIPLNGIGESILITTGRRLTSHEEAPTENIAVMLDGNCSFKDIATAEWNIFWGAYLGMDNEILLSGKLADIALEIERLRYEARERNGWIMDTYLLTKSSR